MAAWRRRLSFRDEADEIEASRPPNSERGRSRGPRSGRRRRSTIGRFATIAEPPIDPAMVA
jgi:hypothetical protein